MDRAARYKMGKALVQAQEVGTLPQNLELYQLSTHFAPSEGEATL